MSMMEKDRSDVYPIHFLFQGNCKRIGAPKKKFNGEVWQKHKSDLI